MEPIPVNVNAVIKQTLVQLKYEEFGSWLRAHNLALFYAHKKGFTLIDNKFIDEHKSLKKVLDKVVKELEKTKQKPKTKISMRWRQNQTKQNLQKEKRIS